MRGFRGRDGINAFVPQRPQVDSFEQRFSPAEQDRRDSEVQFIDQAFTEILADRMS